MSYSALLADERQETYKLPIQLGVFQVHPERRKQSDIDEVALITGVIRCAENNATFVGKPNVSIFRYQ